MNDDQEFGPLFEAIRLTACSVPVLRKGDRNTHGNYNYVSIDDMYEQVASVAHGNGLTWSVNEVSCEVILVGDRPAFKAKYEYAMLHDSGLVMDGFFSTTILHPIQGAQTAGSAMSYASKLFLRHTFSVVTGEQDADATDGAAFDLAPNKPPKPAQQYARVPPSEKAAGGPAPAAPGAADSVVAEDPTADTMARVLEIGTAFLDTCKSQQELTDYWVQNEETFKLLKASDPLAHKKLVAAFKARKAEIGQ